MLGVRVEHLGRRQRIRAQQLARAPLGVLPARLALLAIPG